MSDTNYPLLRVGTLGVHIMQNPGCDDVFSFVGTVPNGLHDCSFASYEDAEAAFVNWFNSLPAEDRRVYIGDLRNDIFKKVMESAI